MSASAIDIAKHHIHAILRNVKYFPGDILDAITGRRPPYTPPRRLWFVGGGDYGAIGKEFLKYFVDLCGLEPHHRVLDVGCGVGRMAVPMLDYLTHGSYDGFDIVPAGIRWSKRVISSRYPNFRFHLADIYNRAYNPTGKYAASEYHFPFDEASFDFIFLTSVVTHLVPRDVERYMAEISRVLKPGGKTLITWFVLDEESRRLIEEGHSSLDFSYRTDEFWSISRENPEQAVAFPEQYIRQLYVVNRLQVEEPIRYGAWSGRKNHLSGQDVVIASKPASF